MKKLKLLFFSQIIFISIASAQFYPDTEKNVIQNTLGNKAWSRFCAKMRESSLSYGEKISIVQMGDSHIQGGYSTAEIRSALSKDVSATDMGWIFPYKLAQTNGPQDVRISSSAHWNAQRYDKLPSGTKTGISGYLLSSNDTMIPLTIQLLNHSASSYPFNSITLIHQASNLIITSNLPVQIKSKQISETLFTDRVDWEEPKDSVTLTIHLTFPSTKKFILNGLLMQNTKAKYSYHSIGTNGMCFFSLNRNVDFCNELKMLHPDCVILSLGTNDALSYKGDSAALCAHISSILAKIRKAAPESGILMTTAGDHLLKKKFSDPGLSKVNNIILQMALRENCVIWDFYAVMGGKGAARYWFKKGWMYRDLLHLSQEGYRIQGDMFLAALKKSIGTTE